MKVVINTCFGGFGLSPQAIFKFAELSGIKVYPYVDIRDEKHRQTEKVRRLEKSECNDNDLRECIYWIKDDLGKEATSKKLNKAIWFNIRDIKRNDELLVKVVKSLGKNANGHCAELKIVEIPDGTEFVIQEYDGSEHIAEAHETWS